MLYITGNMHGEMARFEDSRLRKLKKGDTLVVCGDFGFLWDGGPKEEKNLKKLGGKKYQILFVDGTHENFDLLDQYPETDWNGGKVQKLNDNVLHLMRGQIYEIEGKKFFVFGGGESAEKQMYVDAGKWWEREMPSLTELREAVNHLREHEFKVDYILTHEPAPGMPAMKVNPKDSTNQLDAFFEELVKRVDYDKWFFGSLHIDRKITSKTYSVFNEVVPL